MYHHRDIELGDQLEERPSLIGVRIVSLVARVDQDPLQPVLLDRPLELFQVSVATAWLRRGHWPDAVAGS